eukprot:TRINITY_DN62168_c0_g1_i1.p1 TRINITY_DN62168_c0_g1~~TRINITY_DN62168_c0_g1_i1.p1  ORF type:complete len:1265 (-),score=115.98 TRINITY_DN62168_c0_g1_i1:127-3471(-)
MPSMRELCYSRDTCTWSASEWSNCNSSCGEGIRTRFVACSSWDSEDCAESAPSSSERCRGQDGCSWIVEAWSACSGSCGLGGQNRRVLCSSSNSSDCLSPKPITARACEDATPASVGWHISAWTDCSVVCGKGVQLRNVTCLQGSCGHDLLPARRSCHATYGCAWTTSAWSDCSHPCGSGVRNRAVWCISGSDEDCARLERPLDQQSCRHTTDNCTWITFPWGDCANSRSPTQSGLRIRPVLCPSLGESVNCVGTRPHSIEACVQNSPLKWHLSDWAGCDDICGWGEESRDVSCSGGADGYCVGVKPQSKRPCNSLVGCDWSVGPWSSCGEGCGESLQRRKVVCLKVSCTGQGPATSRPCRATSSCAWRAGPWSNCSADCGSGFQLREITCSSGVDSDCGPKDKHAEWQACQGVRGCAWVMSEWSLCSASCGHGEKYRFTSCSSGVDNDCVAATRPTAVQPCRASCTWRVGTWSVCSSGCGSGVQQRDVWCPSEAEEDCMGDIPSAQRECTDTNACCWRVGDWSRCTSQCGWGWQNRSATCSVASAQHCAALGPKLSQRCFSNSRCHFESSSWGSCSNPCGFGLRVREVACAGSRSGAWCRGPRPANAENCRSDAACNWLTSEWSPCGANCGPSTRWSLCPSDNASDCDGRVEPVLVRVCSSIACLAVSTSQLVLVLISLAVESDVREKDLFGILIPTVQTSVASSLSLPPADVVVTIAPSTASAEDAVLTETPYNASNDNVVVDTTQHNASNATAPVGMQRRLRTHELRFDISIRHATRGSIELLKSSSGSDMLAAQVREDVIARSISVWTCSVKSRVRVSADHSVLKLESRTLETTSSRRPSDESNLQPERTVSETSSSPRTSDDSTSKLERTVMGTMSSRRSSDDVDPGAAKGSGVVLAMVMVVTCLLGATLSIGLAVSRFKLKVPRKGLVAHFCEDAASDDDGDCRSARGKSADSVSTPRGKADSDDCNALRVAALPAMCESTFGCGSGTHPAQVVVEGDHVASKASLLPVNGQTGILSDTVPSLSGQALPGSVTEKTAIADTEPRRSSHHEQTDVGIAILKPKGQPEILVPTSPIPASARAGTPLLLSAASTPTAECFPANLDTQTRDM